MQPIKYENVERTETFMRFFADASELRLAPGEWPDYLVTTMGNGLDLQRDERVGDAFLYRQIGGCITLLVFND